MCIITPGVPADVFSYASIKIDSLNLGAQDILNLIGTSGAITATVATSVTLSPSTGAPSQLSLGNATVHAAEIDDQGGSISGDATCELDSPDIIFGDSASLGATFGTTTLTSLPQLSGGTLSDISIDAYQADIVLPGGITKLVSSKISVQTDSAIETPSGGSALAGLTWVDAQSLLLTQDNLTLTGSSFTADGSVILDGATVTIDGPFTQAAGGLDLEPNVGNAVLDASQVTVDNGGTLSGAGTINASLVNNGSVNATGMSSAGGTLAVNGDYTQARQASYTSGSQTSVGVLAVSGTATLAGEVSTLQYPPRPGSSYPLIMFGSLSGHFTRHTLGFTLSTQANAIDAVIVPQIGASAKTVAPGGTLTVTGASFQFNELVSIYLDHATGTPLAQVTSGDAGQISATVTIPAATAAGAHKLIAVDNAGDRAAKTITVS